MSTLEQIETASLNLSTDEFKQLKQWFLELDYQQWEQQLEQDVAAGKLEELANEAIGREANPLGQNWNQGIVERFNSLYNSPFLEVL